MARKMVCEWGMSDELGPLTYGKREGEIFLGREFNRHQDYSEATALKIDAEITKIVSGQYAHAHGLPCPSAPVSARPASLPLFRKHEVLDGAQIADPGASRYQKHAAARPGSRRRHLAATPPEPALPGEAGSILGRRP